MKCKVPVSVSLLAASTIALSSSFAFAAEVPVSFFTLAKELRQDARAGTLITFSLYDEDSCSSVPLASETLDINAVDVMQVVQNSRVRGDDASTKKLIELHHVMNVVAAPGTDLYLQVTGTGIVSPSDPGGCQAQEPLGQSGATGPAGPVGPAGPTGPVGPAGADGADGADGVDGADGATGPAGATGATGPAGATGADGADGATGPVGPTPYEYWVDSSTGTPAGPVFNTIQNAVDNSIKPATIYVKQGSYTENVTITTLTDNIVLRAETETLTYGTVINGTISFSGNDSAALVGLYLPHNPGSVALIQHTGTGTMRINNCSIQNTAGYPAISLNNASGRVAVDASVLRSDGAAGGQPSVLVTSGIFNAYRTSIIDAGETTNVGMRVIAGSGNAYGPESMAGQLSVSGSATSTISQMNISSGAAPAVLTTSSGLVTLSLVGLTTTATPAVVNAASPVAYSLVGYGSSGTGFTTPAFTGTAPIAIGVSGAPGSGNIVCVKTNGTLGYCATVPAGSPVLCTCN